MTNKTFFFALALMLSSITISAQKVEYPEPSLPIDQETKLITYTKVIDVNANKDSLFRKGKKWFYTFYKNPTGVIKEEDAVNGKIAGKHQIKILNPADKKGIQTMRGIVRYSVTTQYKDNKARMVISEVNLEGTSYTPIEKWLDKTTPGFTTLNYYHLTQLDSIMKVVVSDYEKFMKEPNKVKKDDW